MPHPFSIIRAEKVRDRDTAEQFIMQQLGIGYVTGNDQAIFRRKVQELFDHYPKANWQTIVKTVEWAKTRRKRYSRLYQFLESIRYAMEDGYLPELDPNINEDVDAGIREALLVEEDPTWRRSLLVAQGMQARMAVLERWQNERRMDREYA